MNKLKKYLCPAVVVATFLMLFTGCKGENTLKKIGITQIINHESLDSAKQGFVDELKNFGYENGKNVMFDFQNAGGDLSNCASIADKFVREKNDLVLAISTPAAQAVANVTQEIPILVTAITDPKAAGLVVSNDRPQTNVTGTSDLAPVEKQIELITKLDPHVQKIGVLYSSIDISPQYQAGLAEKAIKNLGLEPKLFSVSQITEVQQVTESLIKEVDALFVPLDKITASSMPQISKIALEHKKFVVCCEDVALEKGAIGAYGLNYYELGKLTAHQAVEILEGKNKPQDIPIEYIKDTKLVLNREIIEKLGIKVPADLMENAEFVN